jgi:hypothetical protein
VEWRQSSSKSTQLQPAARCTGNNNHVECYGKQFERNHEHLCGICCGQNGIGTVFLQALHFYVSRGSSVSIVSGYGLDHREIGIRSPAGAKYFSSNLCVQTGSEAHPASCTMGTGGPFPGAKRGRGVTLTTYPHLVPRSRMSRSYTSSPLKRHHGV